MKINPKPYTPQIIRVPHNSQHRVNFKFYLKWENFEQKMLSLLVWVIYKLSIYIDRVTSYHEYVKFHYMVG